MTAVQHRMSSSNMSGSGPFGYSIDLPSDSYFSGPAPPAPASGNSLLNDAEFGTLDEWFHDVADDSFDFNAYNGTNIGMNAHGVNFADQTTPPPFMGHSTSYGLPPQQTKSQMVFHPSIQGSMDFQQPMQTRMPTQVSMKTVAPTLFPDSMNSNLGFLPTTTTGMGSNNLMATSDADLMAAVSLLKNSHNNATVAPHFHMSVPILEASRPSHIAAPSANQGVMGHSHAPAQIQFNLGPSQAFIQNNFSSAPSQNMIQYQSNPTQVTQSRTLLPDRRNSAPSRSKATPAWDGTTLWADMAFGRQSGGAAALPPRNIHHGDDVQWGTDASFATNGFQDPSQHANHLTATEQNFRAVINQFEHSSEANSAPTTPTTAEGRLIEMNEEIGHGTNAVITTPTSMNSGDEGAAAAGPSNARNKAKQARRSNNRNTAPKEKAEPVFAEDGEVVKPPKKTRAKSASKAKSEGKARVNQTEEEKRAKHRESERKRREQIDKRVWRVSDLIPRFKGLRTKKEGLLAKAELIRYFADFIKGVVDDNQKLRVRLETLRNLQRLAGPSGGMELSMRGSQTGLGDPMETQGQMQDM